MSQSAETPPLHQWRIPTWFNDIDAGALESLKLLHEELVKANRTQTIVAPKTMPFADAIHFADSILATRIIHSDNPQIDEIYDLGSGGGFPGLVGATLHPKTKYILVDIDDKKIEYLRHCVKIMSLDNVKILKANIETMDANSIRFGVCRGLTSISKAILMTRKSFIKEGTLYHIKPETWSAEVGEIPTQLCSVWSPALVKEYRLPIGEVRFAVVKTDKIS